MSDDDFSVIESDSGPQDADTQENGAAPPPPLSDWQERALARMELEEWSGVAWHARAEDPPTATKPDTASHLREIRMEVASWYLQAEGKYLDVAQPQTRLGEADVLKILMQRIPGYFPYEDLPSEAIGDIANGVIYGTDPDPRMSFGVWSGKTYPAPGNPAKRLFRNHMWDCNSWVSPAYRNATPAPRDPEHPYGAFGTFLETAIPGELERNVLLDWLAWSLQNEAQKPDWAIFLFSEEKGTGKSTIMKVAERLFGLDNTAKENGLDKLLGQFANEPLSKKLITVEEVKVTSYSAQGNALKELITGRHTTVDIKYKPQQTLELKCCFILTSNHKPLWLEGGERRYYIIEMSHDGHNQGSGYEAFIPKVVAVEDQISDPARLKALYEDLLARQVSEDFNPRSLNFHKLASPIMRELQDDATLEGDEQLDALLTSYKVSVIPSNDQAALARYLNLKNQQALRHVLNRLGWKAQRVRWNGKQHRVWIRAGSTTENGFIYSPEMSEELPGAVEAGYVWWPLETAIGATWDILMEEKLQYGKSTAEEVRADPLREQVSEDGMEGPFLAPDRSKRYWATELARDPSATAEFPRI